MKKNYGIIMQIILTFTLYLMQGLLFLLSELSDDVHYKVVDGLTNMFFFLAVLNLVIGLVILCIALSNLSKDVKNPAKVTMITKIILIPYYLINLFLWFVIDAILTYFFLPLGIFLIILGIGITYCYMLATSLNDISYVINGLISKRIKPNASIIFALIFLFVFCLDVVGSIVIYIETRNKNLKTS